MKVYISGVAQFGLVPGLDPYNNLDEKEKEILSTISIAESYTNLIKNDKALDALYSCGRRKIFLFPHFNTVKSPEIDIRDYCKFINLNQDIINRSSVLFINHDPLQTYRNQLVMQDLGFVDTIPYFSIGGDYRFLNFYLENYNELIVGGLHGSQKDAVGRLGHINFRPGMQLHGHFLLSQLMMEDFNWFACDTELWRKMATEGIILFNNKLLPISENSKSLQTPGKHFLNMSETEQTLIANEIKFEEFSITRLINCVESRAVYNMKALGRLQYKSKLNGMVELFG